MRAMIVLNGPPGVGKTTVSGELAERSANSVVIHGDDLMHAIKRKSNPAIEGRLGFKGGALLSTMYAAAGFDLVVLDYVFETTDQYRHFLKHYAGALPVHLFTLWAPLDVIAQREAGRPNRARLGDRVAACHRAMAANLDGLGETIDTQHATPPEIAERIAAKVLRAG